jgi:serralysin
VSATAASHRIVYNPTSGVLFYDSDGSGPAAPVRFARLPAGLALTSNDFLVWSRYYI